MDDDLWEQHSQWWQDEFTAGADAEYEEQILPLAVSLLSDRHRLLDVGAGEGQVARSLRAEGVAEVVGVDPTGSQIVEAARRGGGVHYGRADAAHLPFADAVFDAAIACLVFEHIDAADDAISEVARVLAPGGRFVLMLNHPLIQTPGSGLIDDHMVDPPEQYWRIGPYLTESNEIEEVRKGVFIPFIHRPLSRYVNALLDAGLVLDRMIEPAPLPGLPPVPRLLALVTSRAHG